MNEGRFLAFFKNISSVEILYQVCVFSSHGNENITSLKRIFHLANPCASNSVEQSDVYNPGTFRGIVVSL